MNEVYITKAAEYLPNEPIDNAHIEDYLGYIKGNASRSKNIVLRSNKIKTRYYALDREGNATHSNAELAANAIKKILANSAIPPDEIEILGCGTSSPDQMMPAHGYMVHGEVPEIGASEVVTMSGNCCSSVQAMKYAYMALKSGMNHNAIVAGSERVSKLMRAENFEEEATQLEELENSPVIAFEKDFLRWMLSDAGAALLLQDKPNTDGISLRIDFVESISFAHKVETCMYMGGDKVEDGSLKSFKEYAPQEILNNSIFSMKQDVRLLDDNIVKLGFEKLAKLFHDGTIDENAITYFVPHMSSYFFESKIEDFFVQNKINIPKEKWFSNLAYKGNIGAASIFSMIAELLEGGKLKKGDVILLAIPESARFSYVFSQLTVC